MKKIILITLITMACAFVQAQTKMPNGANIQGKALTGAKIQAYDNGLIKLNDNVNNGDYFVSKADTNGSSGKGYVTPYIFKYQYTPTTLKKALKKLGSPIVVSPLTAELGGPGAAGVMSDGTVYYMIAVVVDTVTVTYFVYSLSVQGNFTEDNNNKAGIYSISGTTASLIRSTASSGVMWKAPVGTAYTVPLTASIVLIPGTYLLACLMNSSALTTAPQVNGISTPAWLNYSSQLPFGLPLTGYSSSTKTDLPATVNIASEIYPTNAVPCLNLK